MTKRATARRSADVVVVGAGISGLATAHRVFESAAERGLPVPRVEILEASSRAGGLIRSLRQDGGLFEEGPDSLVTQKKEGLDLVRRLGIEDELIEPRPAEHAFEILWKKRLRGLPPGFHLLVPTRRAPLMRSSLFSLRGKMRLLAEPFVPARSPGGGEESLRDFVVRRFGREAYERLAEPVIGGLFAADAGRLGAEATLSRFTALEAAHGCVSRPVASAVRNQPLRRPPQLSLAGGMERLVHALVDALPMGVLRKGVAVAEASPVDGRWLLQTAAGPLAASSLVLALPPHAAAPLLERAAPEIAACLRRLEFASCASVHLVYRALDWRRPARSHGFFVPRRESDRLLACSYSSLKFEGRAGDDEVAVRAFVGGASREGALDVSDPELIQGVAGELAGVLGLPERPRRALVLRHPRAMPQLHQGYPRWLEDLRRLVRDRGPLHLAGSAHGAYGIPDCVRSAERAADAVLDTLARAEPKGPALASASPESRMAQPEPLP